MSVNKTGYGTYEVRYRDESGRNRSKTFKKKVEADRFDREVKAAKDRARFDQAIAELDDAVRR